MIEPKLSGAYSYAGQVPLSPDSQESENIFVTLQVDHSRMGEGHVLERGG